MTRRRRIWLRREAQSAKQYEDMKLRIQFMYENGSTPVWQMLAEAESFSDFLNRTEYITDINALRQKKSLWNTRTCRSR